MKNTNTLISIRQWAALLLSIAMLFSVYHVTGQTSGKVKPTTVSFSEASDFVETFDDDSDTEVDTLLLPLVFLSQLILFSLYLRASFSEPQASLKFVHLRNQSPRAPPFKHPR